MPLVVESMEAHQVRPKQSFQYLPPPGKEPEYLIGGKWDMEKKTDGHPGMRLPYHLWQKQELVIMYPYPVTIFEELKPYLRLADAPA